MIFGLVNSIAKENNVMYEISLQHTLWALLIGVVSSIALVLGALFGIKLRIAPWLSGVFAAFGGGALIAALSVEMVAPTALALADTQNHHAHTHFLNLIIGSIFGGFLFIGLNQVINSKGGFLRRSSTSIHYFTKKRAQFELELMQDLSKIDLIRKIPLAEMRTLINVIRIEHFSDGEILGKQGEKGDRMFFLRKGKVDLLKNEILFRTLEQGTILGEIALVSDVPRTMTMRANGNVEVLTLDRLDFNQLRKRLPELDAAAREIAVSRLDQIRQKHEMESEEQSQWLNNTAFAVKSGSVVPTNADLKKELETHKGAPLAIWLGLLLDGIPESFVLGTGFLLLVLQQEAVSATQSYTIFQTVPYALVAALFLSNFPEALASSRTMLDHGWKKSKIIFMWTILMILLSLGAVLGYLAGGMVSGNTIAFIEGIAVGAMLTMIAAAMIPEAVHLGGANKIGISTLLGFLVAVSFKLLE